MEAGRRILILLLGHQKQGLYFMMNKERELVDDKKDQRSSSLWVHPNEQKSYCNVITGKVEKAIPR
jgi:transketolase N-terminal domain/subunit